VTFALSLLRRPRNVWRLRSFRRLYNGLRVRNSAEDRSRRLLRRWLTPAQRMQLDTSGFFEVVGSATGKRYRIYFGTVANIHELDETGRPTTGWCFAPQGYLASGDVMLAQKVALETDEPGALAVANPFLSGPLFRHPVMYDRPVPTDAPPPPDFVRVP
jgi:hypothetical protein